jgi:hypothetical protein
MRPVYENKEDSKREADVAKILEKSWKCDLIKMPPKSPFDYAAKRGKLIEAIVEIKTRTNTFQKYPTYMISAEKVCACMQRSIYLRVPFYLVVQFTDGVYYWSSNQEGFTLDVGGRTDRGDTLDLEMVCHIPIDHFKRLP